MNKCKAAGQKLVYKRQLCSHKQHVTRKYNFKKMPFTLVTKM